MMTHLKQSVLCARIGGASSRRYSGPLHFGVRDSLFDFLWFFSRAVAR